ncbi:hypothetical protein CEXT_573061 [Caerostris extrusa]|uniref:Uncharacterized protein n=1 Tax=Caerostris extrusa TaxID=172846 RepID=A0AAV4WNL5_CAEEX|nr:hypothetical protein CEXT_573061 [Caerostris extrusa]
MDEYGQHLRGVIGPYNEGFPLALACEGEGGSEMCNIYSVRCARIPSPDSQRIVFIDASNQSSNPKSCYLSQMSLILQEGNNIFGETLPELNYDL